MVAEAPKFVLNELCVGGRPVGSGGSKMLLFTAKADGGRPVGSEGSKMYLIMKGNRW